MKMKKVIAHVESLQSEAEIRDALMYQSYIEGTKSFKVFFYQRLQ